MTKSRRTGKAHRLQFSDLSNPFQRFRSQVGWSQQQLGEALGTLQQVVARWESGESAPLPKTANAFVQLARQHKVRMSLQEIYPEKEPI